MITVIPANVIGHYNQTLGMVMPTYKHWIRPQLSHLFVAVNIKIDSMTSWIIFFAFF